MQGELLMALSGCLQPHSVQASEMQLRQLSEHPAFVEQLLTLVPQQTGSMLTLLLTTLKNYLMARYNSQDRSVGNDQKALLRGSLLALYYQLNHSPQAVNLYQDILYIVLAVDFPWPGAEQALAEDLTGPIAAGIYFSRQVVKVNEWFQGEQRLPLENFLTQFMPQIETVLEQVLGSYNDETAKLLQQILKTFYSAFHIEVPLYLRDFNRLAKWVGYFETILLCPLSITPAARLMVARCYLKLFALYANEVQDGRQFRGWAEQFRRGFAGRLLGTTLQLVGMRQGVEDFMATLVNCLHEVVKQDKLRELIGEQEWQQLIYGGILLPLCQPTAEERTLFLNDPIEYVRREDDLSCYPIRRAVLDLLEMAASKLSFSGKSEMIRLVEYAATVLATGTEPEREVVIRILNKIGTQLLRNKFLKSQFENLTLQYFVPQLQGSSQPLIAATCELLSTYLPFGDLSDSTVNALMEMVYGLIVNSSSQVVKYASILAFTALLNHRAALEAAQPHFQSILEIYVGILNTFDHENLLTCLQAIVRHFSAQIEHYAPQLVTHLLRMFAALSQSKNTEEDEDEPDSNSPATAALSTIKQILSSDLRAEIYETVAPELVELLRGIFNAYDRYFDEILSLFNVLVHRSPAFPLYEYPFVACCKLLEGDNAVVLASGLSGEDREELLAVEKADSEFEETLVSILKNLLQKMPPQLLERYPLPRHQQLLLCLIENKRLDPQQFGRLDTSMVDAQWSAYLTGYSYFVYGIGSLAAPHTLKPIVGVSLVPWLQQPISLDLLKLALNSIEDEQDDDLEQQNTAQMLQRCANEDDDEQDDYCESSGDNYGFLYDSPFPSSNDAQLLLAQLKQLPQQAANSLMANLSGSLRKKLQILCNK